MSLNLSFIKFDDSLTDVWESINHSANSSFLTSINWINFQKSLGKQVEMYLIKNNDEFVGNIYIEIFKRKIAKYAYSPYGPVIDYKKFNPNKFKDLFSQIKSWQYSFAKEKSLNCFRMDPLISADKLDVLQNLGYVKSMAPTQAKYVWEIDITKDEEVLLAEMKKVARYNIRNSAKAGIQVVRAKSTHEVKHFFNILSTTTKRHEFTSFNEDYFLKQFELLKDSMFNLYLAKIGNQFISAALINTYDQTGYYSHGGSLNSKELQKYGASYLLHWEIIKDLKQRGFKTYNMWGIVPESMEVNNGMQGVSDFKKRFGGKEVNYVGGLDVKVNKLYTLQRLSEKFIYKKDRY